MIFTSLIFWGFFTIVFDVYWLLRERGAQNLVLLLAS